MTVTAKMTCTAADDAHGGKHVYLNAVYSADPNHPNYSWSKATPGGQVTLAITNPDAFDAFVPGEEYLVTFAHAPKPVVEAPVVEEPAAE